ncbi:MFS transporter [Halogeometricum luteum]|uniref:MFS transporter n=1 Tax=Halogeometricum luteum TaxID=2950537 RepID=A0ABU2FX09_9EURY|nr:MFS transporter [Halogeometricum sp. S3BR5-2]MDS0292558.1 MFS transporter [Halogeometricum sp. S3BR5-2]
MSTATNPADEEGSALGGGRKGFRYWAPAVVAASSMFLGVLDSSMMNVAVPAIARDLDTSVSALQGAIAVYSMVMAALIIPGGSLRAAIDTKRLLVATLAVYSVGTLLAGFSWSMAVLFLGWSVIEGMAAALLLPITYSLIVENYRGSDRARAFGAVGGVTAVGVAVGPMIGGTLTTYASWRWGLIGEFFVVLGIVALTLRYLESNPSDGRIRLDVGGTVLSILGIVGVIGGSLLAGHYGWVRPLRPLVVEGALVQPLGLSPAIWCIGLGAALLVLFVQWELRQERRDRPTLVPPTVLRNRTFAAGISTFASESLFLSGFMFTVPVFLQSALGLSAFDSGVALLPFSVATLVVAVVSTGWRRYAAQKRIVQAGLVLIGAGMLLLLGQTGLDQTVSGMILPMSVIGIGLGLFTGQLVDLTMSAVPESYSDVSSGVINSLSQLGYAFGTAVVGSIQLAAFYSDVVAGATLLSNGTAVTGEERRQLAVKLEDAVETTTQAQQQAFVNGLSPDVQRQLTEIIREAMVSAQRSVFVVLVLFVLVTLLASSFLTLSKPRRGRTREPSAAPRDAEPESASDGGESGSRSGSGGE